MQPARANITIGVPTNHVHSIGITGMPAGLTATSTLDPDPVVYLGAAAAGGVLANTFAADIAQYPGWTLNFAGAGLAGTLNIGTYSATNLGGGVGGATMDATYVPGVGDPANLTFLQVYIDNPTAGMGTHVDPFPNDDTQPFYYTTAERATFGLNFNDNPSNAAPPAGQTASTTFDTYLVSFNVAAKTVTAYDGFQWGFDVATVGAAVPPVPEPCSLILSAMGISGVSLFARARKRWA